METFMNNRNIITKTKTKLPIPEFSRFLDQEFVSNLLTRIKYPLITEKAINLYDNGYYTFVVDRTLTKTEIKYILQKIFQVTITDLNTSIFPVKTRRVGKFVGKRARYKKAYIKVKKGQSISDLLT